MLAQAELGFPTWSGPIRTEVNYVIPPEVGSSGTQRIIFYTQSTLALRVRRAH